MANGYSIRNYVKAGASVTLGASETDTVVSDTFAMSAEDSKYCLIRIDSSSVTDGGADSSIIANLQHSWDGGTTWEDVGSDSQVVIAANATYQIEHRFDNTNATLTWPLARVVVSTASGDAATIDAVYVSRRY